jgi:ProP effector
MDQLIQQLQHKVAFLLQELNDARAEIAALKRATSTADSEDTTSPYDLLSQMNNLTPNDQLQLYIEDSLDIETAESTEPTEDRGDSENQLSFDLPPEINLFDSMIENTDLTPHTPTTENAYATEKQVTLEELTNFEDASTEKNTDLTHASESDSVEMKKEAMLKPTDSEPVGQEAEASTEEQQLARKRKKNKQNNIKLIQLLERKYPKAFNWNNPSPLKIGIDKEMQLDDELTESKLKRALAAYTRSDRYKKSVNKQKLRIDLDGKPILPKKAAKKPIKANTENTVKPVIDKAITNKVEVEPDDGLSNEERMKRKLNLLLSKNKH